MFKNLNEIFIENTKKNKDSLYIKTSELEVTFGEFYNKVVSWQDTLIKNNIKKGDRVAIISEKCPDQLTAFYSIWSLGAIVVPINESLGSEETKFILTDSKPILTLTSNKFFNSTKKIIAPVISFDSFEGKDGKYKLVEVESDDVAALIYTSGSTGNPKGVMSTHDNFIVNASTAADYAQITDSDSFYSLLPFWHSFALTVEVAIPMLKGASVYFAKGQRDFAKNIPDFKPSIILAVPRVLEVIKSSILKKVSASPKIEKVFKGAHSFMDSVDDSRNPLKKIAGRSMQNIIFKKVRATFGENFRFFISGGAPLDSALQSFYVNMGLVVIQGYGLSETSPIISVDSFLKTTAGSVGPVLSWMTPELGGDFTFIDDKGNTGKDLEGELLVKGRCVMKGYWNYSDSTAKLTDKSGWLHTGDVGVLDKNGKLFIKGRKTNMIVLAGGEKVHPEHIEDILKKSDHIEDVMILGEKCKNVYACVTVSEDFYIECSITLKKNIWREIKDHTAHLAPYQKPKDFIILPNFSQENGTYTGTMKIRRHVIHDIHQEEIRLLLPSAKQERAL